MGQCLDIQAGHIGLSMIPGGVESGGSDLRAVVTRDVWMWPVVGCMHERSRVDLDDGSRCEVVLHVCVYQT